MLFPAAKNMDFMVGVDLHLGFGFPVHPFFGPIYAWLTPKFPQTNVFINNQPACAVGGTGYSVHIPTVWPPVNPFNLAWFGRLFLNIPMVLMTVAVTTLVNSIIALTVARFAPKSPATQEFVQTVTGIDVSSTDSAVKGALGSFKSFTGDGWAATWLQLLMSAIPYPISNGSPGIANPTVHVNGAPLAIGAPLTTITCSDPPVAFFPNAVTLATSNVLVSLSLSQFLMGAGAHMASSLIQEGVSKGISRVVDAPNNKNNTDADDGPDANNNKNKNTDTDIDTSDASQAKQSSTCSR